MADQNVSFQVNGISLEGTLNLRDEDCGLVLFAHGSGSSRHSSRNQFVANELQRAGIGTFLFDLLTKEEEAAERETRHLRFDIPMLARRLVSATEWIIDNASTKDVPLGYFGSSTGAAAALMAAAQLPDQLSAIVSRGGRPDLAGDSLRRVTAPTLLIVGKDDPEVLALNEEAYSILTCEKSLQIVTGASHLFEEPGKLEMVAGMASAWFLDRLKPLVPDR